LQLAAGWANIFVHLGDKDLLYDVDQSAFLVHPTAPAAANDWLNAYLSQGDGSMFTDDIHMMPAFAAALACDAGAAVLHRLIKDRSVDTLALPGGWTARRLDMDTTRAGYFEFANPVDGKGGFVVEGRFDGVFVREEPAPGEEFRGLSMVEVGRLKEIRVHAYETAIHGHVPTRQSALKEFPYHARTASSLVLKHTVAKEPKPTSDFPLAGFETVTSSPQLVLQAMGLLGDTLRVYDPAALSASVTAWAAAPYRDVNNATLALKQGIRAAMASDRGFPARETRAFFERLWSTSLAVDIAEVTRDFDNVHATLFANGHRNSRKAYSGISKGTVYAVKGEQGDSIVVSGVEERGASLMVTKLGDRLIAERCTFSKGERRGLLADLLVEQAKKPLPIETVPFAFDTARLLQYGLKDIAAISEDLEAEPSRGYAL
jgi:hypothetical protein